MNFDKYKNRLIEYLQLKDIKAQRGLIRCFNPNHEDKKPSCELFDDHFICYSGKCGIHGDIYDAVEILEGITDKAEQYKAIERAFDGNYTPTTALTKTEEKFTPDKNACSALEKYLLKNPSAQKGIKIFLSDRAHASGGKQALYPSGIKDNLVKYFLLARHRHSARGNRYRRAAQRRRSAHQSQNRILKLAAFGRCH